MSASKTSLEDPEHLGLLARSAEELTQGGEGEVVLVVETSESQWTDSMLHVEADPLETELVCSFLEKVCLLSVGDDFRVIALHLQ
jgi:hypothetical protein